MANNEIKVVIGSWGSYNECNERALGSKWLTLNDYDDWEEIVEELENEGFELDGIDEELFIQDIENFVSSGSVNWDYVHPQSLFELLKKSGVLDDEDKYERAVIYCDIQGYHYWKERVEADEDAKRHIAHAAHIVATLSEIPSFLFQRRDWQCYQNVDPWNMTKSSKQGISRNF